MFSFKLLFTDSTLGAATELEFFGGRKGNDYLNEIRKEKTRSRRSKKKERSAAAWSVVVTEVVDGNDNYEANFEANFEAKQQQRSQAEAKMEDDQDSAFESDGYKGDSDCEGSVGRGGGGARAGPPARPRTAPAPEVAGQQPRRRADQPDGAAGAHARRGAGARVRHQPLPPVSGTTARAWTGEASMEFCAGYLV